MIYNKNTFKIIKIKFNVGTYAFMPQILGRTPYGYTPFICVLEHFGMPRPALGFSPKTPLKTLLIARFISAITSKILNGADKLYFMLPCLEIVLPSLIWLYY